MLKLPRTIRLDPSDTFVFERAAEPGEWAVSGAFVFWNRDPADARPEGARGAAFGLSRHRQSWLVDARDRDRGDGSGAAGRWSSASRRNCWRNSARRILPPRGWPPRKRSRLRPRCAITPAQTLLAVQRSVEDGEIRERFRTLRPREAAADADPLHAHARAFTFHEVEGDDEPAEQVDLMGLIRTDRMTRDRT